MPARKSDHRQKPHTPPDLHGNAPDKCEVALLLVDVVNDFDFDGGDALLKAAQPAAETLAGLKKRAVKAEVPVIYANDNFGRWRSDFGAVVRHVRDEGTKGAKLAELLAPTDRDYFVLKPKHSAFYETCLGLLLHHLGVKSLVIGGFATDNCVTFTANDAYLRGYGIFVPSDGAAAQSRAAHIMALEQMQRVLHARTPRASELSFVRGKQGTGVRVAGG